MLKQDKSAGFAQAGFWTRKYRFGTHGNMYLGPILSAAEYSALLQAQMKTPVPLTARGAKQQQWWMFRNGFFWEDEGLTSAEIEALLIERAQKQRRRLERAMAVAQRQKHPEGDSSNRKPIPDDVKMFVWQRDKGRCVKCGSQYNLEFDHIIPVAMGGSNTARNLQLLCETCNRSKGASIS